LAASFGHRYGSLQIQASSSGPLAVTADAQRLEQVGRLLLINACQSARSRVDVRTGPGPSPGQGEGAIAHDRHGAAPQHPTTPNAGSGARPGHPPGLKPRFATTQQALSGPGLALARRVAELHGGHVPAANRPEGGFRVSIILPTRPPRA